MIIIGTTGSTDFLHDTTGNKRFWPVNAAGGASMTFAPVPMPLSDDQLEVLGALKDNPRRVGHTSTGGKVSSLVVRRLCILGFVALRPGGVAAITAPGLDAYMEALR